MSATLPRCSVDDLRSRAGMDTAEHLGASFDLDVTSESLGTASLDVPRGRMAEYELRAAEMAP